MGMFDYVAAAPQQCSCGGTVEEWQSKDGPCELLTIKPEQVRRFYGMCERCNKWYEFTAVSAAAVTFRLKVARNNGNDEEEGTEVFVTYPAPIPVGNE